MISFVYKMIRLEVGQNFSLPDGDVLSGSNIEPDQKGGFRIVVHILQRNDQAVAAMSNNKELTQ